MKNKKRNRLKSAKHTSDSDNKGNQCTNCTCKDTTLKAQIRKVFDSLMYKPKTMLMVSIETNILRANICRYVAQLKKDDMIQLIEKRDCEVSKYKAGYYYTGKEVVK